jgi:hypothetical protein
MGSAGLRSVVFWNNQLIECLSLCAGRDYVWGTGKVGVKCEGKWVKTRLGNRLERGWCRPFEVVLMAGAAFIIFVSFSRCHGDDVGHFLLSRSGSSFFDWPCEYR